MAARILPSPKAVPFLGTLPSLLAAGGATKLHEYVNKRHQEFGPIYKERLGPVDGIFICDPEYMRRIFGAEGKTPRHIIPESWALYNEVYKQKRGLLFIEFVTNYNWCLYAHKPLVFSDWVGTTYIGWAKQTVSIGDGDEWLHFRKIMNGIFLKPDSDILVPAISLVAEELVKKWENSNKIENLEKTLYAWSLETILSILLGSDAYSKQRQDFQGLVGILSEDLHRIFIESANMSLFPAKIAMKWNLPPWKRFVQAIQGTFKTAAELMNRLQSRGTSSNGLLKHMVASGVSTSDLHRLTTDMILAAGDTTAYTTQWLLYLLGKHPQIQQKIFETITTDDMAVENQYLKGSLRETLRLYPVAPFLTRYLPHAIELDGYFLEKDSLVIMSLYTSGRDEKIFPNSNEFRPERWGRNGREYSGVRNPYGSLPFAMGARSCVGRKIAETQICITIKKIISSSHLLLHNEGDVEIKLHLITVPDSSILLSLQKR